ncbi:unnamed protein product [Heterobilharzia americana]|nr:unnamed protein product [Heterobilharzia americana]
MGAQQTKERPRRANHLKSDTTSCFQEHGPGTNFKGSPLVQLPQINQLNDQILVALFDFFPPNAIDNQSQIRVEKGDHLYLFGYSADGDWADVECLRTNDRGWIPTNYTGRIPVNPNDQCTNLNTGSASGSSLTFQQAISRDVSCNGSQGSLAGVGLESEKWYHGAIQRSYAEYLLNSGITGSFLVRESESHPGQLTISLRYEGQIWHYRIHRDDSNLYFVIESNKFASVSELVHHHEKHSDGLACTLLYPAPKRDKTSSELRMDPGFDVREIDRTEIVMKHKLGSGQYGVVYEAVWKPYNVLVAVKTLKENVTVRDEFLEEARLMKSLRHPNLVTLLGACTREPPYYIVTEFMCNGNLLDYLRKQPRTELTPSVLLHMATQVARGMAYLEQHNFIHRDLAARNCLVGTQHTIKVADFGLARCIERDLTYRAHEGAKFPIKWTAPEGLVYNIFSTKSDVWAFGVLLWEIATYGKTPYPGVELQDVYVLLERGTRMLCPDGCPEPVYQLMLQCWQWHPEQRPPFSDILNQLESMQTNTTIDEQVASELASSSNINEVHTVSASELSKLLKRPQNVFPRPPLPPRPPPPRRSTSCDHLIDESTESKCDKMKANCISEDYKSDTPVNMSTNNHKSHGNIFTRNLKNPLSKQLHIDDLSTEEFCTSEKDIPFTTSGSLGHCSLLDDNANITGSVFSTAYWNDYKNDFDHTPLPPPPSSCNLLHLETVHHSTQQSLSHQLHSRVTQPNGSLSANPNSVAFTMPSIMSSSAIFPSGLFSYVDPIPCDDNLTRSVCPDHPISTNTPLTSTKHCHSSKSSLPTKSVSNSDFPQKSSSDIHSKNPLSLNHSHIRRNIDNNLLKECKSIVHQPSVASADFQEELRDRLKQHSQQLKDWSSSKPIASKAVPDKLFGNSNSPLCNQEKTDSKLSVPNNSPYFTIPRLKPLSSTNPGSVSVGISSNTTSGQTEPPRYPSELIRSLASSQNKFEKCIPSSTASVSSNATNTLVNKSSKDANSSPKFHPKRHEKENHDKLSSIIQKRLSWTGPTDDNSSGSQKRSQRLCLPTIFSTSSTALDEVSSSSNHCVPPTRNHLKKHLSHIVEELEDLTSPGSNLSSVTTTISSSSSSSMSNSEHLIELADQMEACRLSCSVYIDQATCSARAKFSFRDRFACLQTFSSLLRSKKLDSSYSQNKTNLGVLKDAKNAINEIINDLNKLTEDVNTTTLPLDSSKSLDHSGHKQHSTLTSNQSTLNCTENLNITDNRSTTVFT